MQTLAQFVWLINREVNRGVCGNSVLNLRRASQHQLVAVGQSDFILGLPTRQIQRSAAFIKIEQT